MPHYNDGTEAKTGDKVRGTLVSPQIEVEGYVLSISESESCNMYVCYLGKHLVDFDRFSYTYMSGYIGKSEKGLFSVIAATGVANCKDFKLVARE